MHSPENFDRSECFRAAACGFVVRGDAKAVADNIAIFGRVAAMTLAVIVAAACTHRSPVNNLEVALTLRVVDAPDQIKAGHPIEVTFGVRNRSGVALSLCSPGGVTMHVRSEQPSYIWPIVVHGFTTDTYCSGPFALKPGEEKVFVERGATRRDLPAGSASLLGYISLYCDPRLRLRCTQVQLETHKVVQITSSD